MPWGSHWGGTLPGHAGGVPDLGNPPARSAGGYPGRGYLTWVPPCQGTPTRVPTPPPGYPPWPQGGSTWGGTQVRTNIGSTCYTAGGMPLAFTQGGLSCFVDVEFSHIQLGTFIILILTFQLIQYTLTTVQVMVEYFLAWRDVFIIICSMKGQG